LVNDSVTGAKIRLDNNQALRARNALNSADIDLFKLDTSNRFTLQPSTLNFTNSTFTIAADTADGADSKTLRLTGGGAYAAGRGASLALKGVEAGGGADLFSESGNIRIATSGAATSVALTAVGTDGLYVLSGGVLNTPQLTASLPVFTDASKNLVTNSISTAWTALSAGATFSDFTPSLSKTGSGTLSAASSVSARMITIGKERKFFTQFSVSVTGSAIDTIIMTYPGSPTLTAPFGGGSVHYYSSVDTFQHIGKILFGTVGVELRSDAAAGAFPVGDYIIRISGIIELP
jgi:hypothetical protein